MDDRGHELLWRAISGHDKYVRRRSWHLEIIELGVQEPGGKEMLVPGGEPGHVCVITDIQEHEPCGGTPVQEHILVGAFECRARYDTRVARRGALIHPGADRTQPRPPVVVGQRNSGGHLGHAGGRMKGIAVTERPAKPARQQGADRRLAAARDPGHHHDHRVTPRSQPAGCTLAQSAAMSITVHFWSAAAARIWTSASNSSVVMPA